jgi:fatty acid desaturase
MAIQTAPAPAGYTPAAESVRIRDAMPTSLALPLTMLTGKPHTGQRAIRLGPTTHVTGAAASLAVGLVGSWFALDAGGWWSLFLIPTCAMTLHGMRNARMMIYHQSAHRNLWGRLRPDRILGRLVAGLLMVQDFDRYSAEHVTEHHAASHMTVRDPTVQAFLIGLGLAPGMTRREMWRRVNRKLWSPLYHASFLSGRIQSYFRPASWRIRILTVILYALVAAAVTIFDAWLFVLVAWVLPLTIFYQVSNTLRLCVKHTFPPPDAPQRRGRDYFGSLTNAIFIGESPPHPRHTGARRLASWLRWWFRMAFIHFPARYLVLTGDTVVHDYHHRHPMDRNWGNYIFARQADVDGGHRGWPEYREVWGLVPAINLVFDSISRADPTDYNIEHIGQVSRRDLFSAYDD